MATDTAAAQPQDWSAWLQGAGNFILSRAVDSQFAAPAQVNGDPTNWPGYTPQGQPFTRGDTAPASGAGATTTGGTGISSNTLLLIGGALLVFLMVRK